MKTVFSIIIFLLLAGCANTTQSLRQSQNKAAPSRIQYIIIHSTLINLESSLKVLTQGEVSSHYLISDNVSPVIYNLVDDNNTAWHAGVSYWAGTTMLNESSIGIELVHPGFDTTPSGRVWKPFPQAQIDQLISLVKDLSSKYHVRPDHILSHGEIAPDRRQDPGPTFPWAQLAKENLIIWPEPNFVKENLIYFKSNLPSIKWFQENLSRFGYAVSTTGIYDQQTKDVLLAFQMKYRPKDFSGQPDAETAALLTSLLIAHDKLEKLNIVPPDIN